MIVVRPPLPLPLPHLPPEVYRWTTPKKKLFFLCCSSPKPPLLRPHKNQTTTPPPLAHPALLVVSHSPSRDPPSLALATASPAAHSPPSSHWTLPTLPLEPPFSLPCARANVAPLPAIALQAIRPPLQLARFLGAGCGAVGLLWHRHPPPRMPTTSDGGSWWIRLLLWPSLLLRAVGSLASPSATAPCDHIRFGRV